MKTGSSGTFVISWMQSEIEGEAGAPLGLLRVGAAWSWRGTALRIDGPQDVLVLHGAAGAAEVRVRANRMLRSLIGFDLVEGPDLTEELPDPADPEFRPFAGQGFSVTDGYGLWEVTVVEGSGAEGASGRLLCFAGRMPPAETELWVVSAQTPQPAAWRAPETGFVAGTMIETPAGPRPVEVLGAGDRVVTRDAGVQTVLWVGHHWIGAARLMAEPELRPVRIRAGAPGFARLSQDLLVAPGQRILIAGSAARALFNADEVLVAARDLVDGRTISRVSDLGSVGYIDLLLGSHQVLKANGIASESLHPANSDTERLDPMDRLAMLRALPEIADNIAAYGDTVCRPLNRGEAAILRQMPY